MISISKWQKMTLPQQLGNIGSEISRAKHWEKEGDTTSLEQAVFRALGLIDLTIEAQTQFTRRRELCRLREVLCSWYAQKKDYNANLEALESYCLFS